jgi:hypothetical protein
MAEQTMLGTGLPDFDLNALKVAPEDFKSIARSWDMA